MRLGDEPDDEAIRVEQGEFGISNKQKIGTDFLITCVGVVARNRQTGETLVAHIDDNNSLQALESSLLALSAESELDIHLFGANSVIPEVEFENPRSFDPQSEELRAFTESKINTRSLRQLLLLLTRISNCFLQSVDIGNGDVYSFVVDPQTNVIYRKSPNLDNPHRFANLGSVSPGNPINFAFDTRHSEQRSVWVNSTNILDDASIESNLKFAGLFHSVSIARRLLAQISQVSMIQRNRRLLTNNVASHKPYDSLQWAEVFQTVPIPVGDDVFLAPLLEYLAVYSGSASSEALNGFETLVEGLLVDPFSIFDERTEQSEVVPGADPAAVRKQPFGLN